MKMKLGFKIL